VRKPTIRERVARWLAPKAAAVTKRLYQGAKTSRGSMNFGAGGNTSADAELSASLTVMRSRSRQMVRDQPYAKRAKLIVVNNVIGSGVGMQAQVMTTRGELARRVNDDIETAWRAWAKADNCHMGGALHFSDMERAAMGQVFEAGEVFIRLHYTAVGKSRVPLALELIEAERLAHEYMTPTGIAAGNELRMGVEVDSYGRAVAYWMRERHGGDIRSASVSDKYERVPAADIFHLKTTDRWPQTRGEPWLHTVLRKLDDMNEYTAAEVAAARASAYYFATIYRPDDQASPLPTGEDAENKAVMDIEPLMVQELAPGERLDFHKPDRPNSGLDPFLRYMLREVAAGSGVSYESLSRDYSQSNYSSSRLALLDDRDLYKATQQWWIRAFRQPLHAIWLRMAVYARAIEAVPIEQYAVGADKFEAVLFKLRGWSWIDPTKEVTAYREAIKGGLTTLTDVIAATGGGLDIEDVIATRKRELEMLDEAGILVDTTVLPEPEPVAPAPPAAEPVEVAEKDDEDDKPDAKRRIERVA
jgi:lambda family phage portal protein